MTIKEIMDEAVSSKELAGLNLLVFKDSKEIMYEEAGFKNIESKTPYSRDTITRLYSMSKPVTGASCMKLLEDGLLDLNAPLDRYLPAFKDLTVYENGSSHKALRAPLIREVLSMTAGFTYEDETIEAGRNTGKVFKEIIDKLGTSEEIETVEMANKLAKAGLCYDPGSKWRYSTSADIMGAVVEEIAKEKFGDFLSREFFEPLEMNDTGFFVDKSKVDRLADVYEKKDGELSLYKTDHLGIKYCPTERPKYEAGGAGLFSTLDDYSHFASMLLQNGSYKGKQILKPSTVEFFTNPNLLSWQQEWMWKNCEYWTGFTYGNFLRKTVEHAYCGHLSFKGEYGWDGWLGCYFTNIPSKNATVLLSMQKRDAGTCETTRRIRNALFDILS